MLTIAGNLPVSWRCVTADEAALLAPQYASHNASLLRIMQLVETSGSAEHGDEANASSELHRIEAKLDLVVDLLGELLGKQHAAPACLPVRCNVETLELQLESAPAVGAQVAIELYLNPRLPRPLRFIAICEQAVASSQGSAVSFRWLDLGPPVREELERQIFLWHRRSLQRSGSGTGSTRI
jgi:hypothetical protein